MPRPPGSRLQHTVYEPPVRILLECILVQDECSVQWPCRGPQHYHQWVPLVSCDYPDSPKLKKKCVYVVWMHWPKQTKSKLLCNDRGLCDTWNKELCEHCRYANHLWETLEERSRHCNTDVLTQILQVMMLCGEKTQKLLVSTDSELSLCSCICLQNEFYQACDIALKKVKELCEK